MAGENPSYNLGTIHEVLRPDAACVFCRLVRQTLTSTFGEDAIKGVLNWAAKPAPSLLMCLNPLDVTYDCLKTSSGEIAHYADIHLRNGPNELFQILHSNSIRLKGKIDGFSPQIIALRDDHSDSTEPVEQFGRVVDPCHIPWVVLTEWLANCMKCHFEKRQDLASNSDTSKTNKPLELRVVDVDQDCLVTLPDDAAYVALSYVWGKDQQVKLMKSNTDLLNTPGAFKNRKNAPSKTITHAIRATRRLGYRYLWVDALCIVQDDLENIQANVNGMRQVYSDASFTLVAAAGYDADYGLPGVTLECPRKENQMRTTINKISMSNRLDTAIDFSHWNTRGWTFQEKLLSPRLLYFTDSQVTYHCDEGCNHEEQFHNSNGNVEFNIHDSMNQLDFETYDIFEVYALAVKDYTSRSISYLNDKVRAFDGVLQSLQKPFKGPFLYGLPLTMLDVALLWIPTGRCTRGSAEFPSWSWAGWQGCVQYDYQETKELVNLAECSVVQCNITTGSGVEVVATETTKDKHDTDKWSHYFDEVTSRIIYEESGPGPQKYKYPRILQPFTQPFSFSREQPPTILKILGKVATFRLTGQHSGFTGGKASCVRGQHKRCNLAVLDHEGRAAGMVVVDSHLVPQLQNREHKFLAISRSTLSRQADDITWDEERNHFRMWTEQKGHSEKKPHTTYEPYQEHFKEWVAELPTDMDAESPLISEPIKQQDRSSVFTNSIESELNRDAFDGRYFSDTVWWPILNVILLSVEEQGVVERLGVGQIHVDAFYPNAVEATVLLG